MIKKLTLFITVLMLLFATVLCTSCDFSIYDAEGRGFEASDLFKDITIKDVLNAQECYDQLLVDLLYMKNYCCEDEKLAAMQSYTIMISYGMADISKQTRTFTTDQIKTKANLYDAIKQINFYTNILPTLEIGEGELSELGTGAVIKIPYDSAIVEGYTDEAIKQCKQIMLYLANY